MYSRKNIGEKMLVKTSEINLFYEKAGHGTPLIMLHGNGEDHTVFNKAVSVLKNNYTVYAIDTRGHGKSDSVSELHYEDMAEDIYEFINILKLEKPVVYGFSDGGIVALILAIKHPDLLSKIIISGVNAQPNGLKRIHLLTYKISYFFSKSSKIKLMLTEPNITDEMLKSIKIPAVITAGSNDMIKLNHMKHIAECIPNCTFRVFNGELHGSYVVNSTKIAEFILNNAN